MWILFWNIEPNSTYNGVNFLKNFQVFPNITPIFKLYKQIFLLKKNINAKDFEFVAFVSLALLIIRFLPSFLNFELSACVFLIFIERLLIS